MKWVVNRVNKKEITGSFVPPNTFVRQTKRRNENRNKKTRYVNPLVIWKSTSLDLAILSYSPNQLRYLLHLYII
jgi:hypothetical protein